MIASAFSQINQTNKIRIYVTIDRLSFQNVLIQICIKRKYYY